MDMYRGLFLSVKEQPNLGYAGWPYMPSLCVYYDVYVSHLHSFSNVFSLQLECKMYKVNKWSLLGPSYEDETGAADEAEKNFPHSYGDYLPGMVSAGLK